MLWDLPEQGQNIPKLGNSDRELPIKTQQSVSTLKNAFLFEKSRILQNKKQYDFKTGDICLLFRADRYTLVRIQEVGKFHSQVEIPGTVPLQTKRIHNSKMILIFRQEPAWNPRISTYIHVHPRISTHIHVLLKCGSVLTKVQDLHNGTMHCCHAVDTLLSLCWHTVDILLSYCCRIKHATMLIIFLLVTYVHHDSQV